MNDTERFSRLKDRVEEMSREKDRADGALRETMKRLESKFGVKTVKEAEKLKESYKDKIARLQAEIDKLLTELENSLEKNHQKARE